MTALCDISNEICIPELSLPKIVVIGAGFAGINFIKEVSHFPCQVILFDKNNYHQFQPLLYQVATSGLEPDAISFPLRKLFKGFQHLTYRMAEVEKIDTVHQKVYTDIGYTCFDYLVLATGSANNFYGLPGVEENAVGLKSISEGLDIRSLMLQNLEKAAITCDEQERDLLTNFIIVGGGPAGVEMAGALAEFKNYILPSDYPEFPKEVMNIYLLEAGPRLLMTMSKDASFQTFADLQKMSVDIRLNTEVKAYDGEKVTTGGGSSLQGATLIWTAGVKGAFPPGIDQKALIRGNRIKVNHFNQVEGLDRVFAIGDVAAMLSKDTPRGHPMVAPAAIQQGKQLGLNILRLLSGKPLRAFKYSDKGSLATIGKRRAVADIWGKHLKGITAWWIWSTIHLLSIIGFRNKLMVGLSWLSHYLSYDKGNRLIIRKYIKESRDTKIEMS